MKRLATFLLLAGFVQIPLWAGEYFMPPKPLLSRSSSMVQTTGLLSLPPKPLFSSEPRASATIAPSPKIVTNTTVVATQPATGLLSLPPKPLFSSSQPHAENQVFVPITAPPGKPVGQFMPPKPLFSPAPQSGTIVLAHPMTPVQAPIKRVEQTVVVGTAPIAGSGTVGTFMPPRPLFGSWSKPTAEHIVVEAPRTGSTTTNMQGVFMPPRPLLSGPLFASSNTGGVFMPPRPLFSSGEETATRPISNRMGNPVAVPGVSMAGPRSLAEIEAAYPVWSGHTFGAGGNALPANAVSVYPTRIQPTIPQPQPMFSSPSARHDRPADVSSDGNSRISLSRFFSPVRPADYIPTVAPQYPLAAPQYQATGGTMPLPTGYRLIGNEQPAEPLQGPYSGPSYGPYSGPSYGANCGPTCSRWDGLFTGRLRAWAFFQPTTRDALPRLQPLPYVGPVLAFRCDGSGGCAVAGGGGCGVGNGSGNGSGCAGNGGLGRAGVGFAGRGCRTGCVPPADDAIPGYHFGGRPAVEGGAYQQYGSVTSYKPAAPAAAPITQTGATKYFRPTYTPTTGVQPAGGDVLSRPLTRP